MRTLMEVNRGILPNILQSVVGGICPLRGLHRYHRVEGIERDLCGSVLCSSTPCGKG